MLPNAEFLCDPSHGGPWCAASLGTFVLFAQAFLGGMLGVANLGVGVRHWLGFDDIPTWLVQRFALATGVAGLAPLGTGLWLREEIRTASYWCYVDHGATACAHTLVDRGVAMGAVVQQVAWIEGLLLGACLISLALASLRPRKR